jgi:hypothetical protein
MDLLTILLVVFVVTISSALVAVLWYVGNWKVAAVTSVFVVLQGLHIYGLVRIGSEFWRAVLLVSHPVGTISGGITGAVLWVLFYSADRQDVVKIDSQGEEIGHKTVPKARAKEAIIVGGTEIPTRRQDGTNAKVWLVKEWLFRDGQPDVFVVPWEENLDPDEAFSHIGKVKEIYGDLEDDSKLVDRLKLSVRKLCRKSYKMGVYDAGKATDDSLDMGGMKFWDEMEDHIDDVQSADLEEYREDPEKDLDDEEDQEEEGDQDG